MKVTLIPLNPHAEGILAKELNGDPVIEITQIGDGRVLVFNPHARFATWISTKGDPDWGISLDPPASPPSPPVNPTEPTPQSPRAFSPPSPLLFSTWVDTHPQP